MTTKTTEENPDKSLDASVSSDPVTDGQSRAFTKTPAPLFGTALHDEAAAPAVGSRPGTSARSRPDRRVYCRCDVRNRGVERAKRT